MRWSVSFSTGTVQSFLNDIFSIVLEQMINTPGNGRKCRHQGSVSSDRVGLFDSTDMLFCSDATANELLNEIQKTDHLNFYSSENSNLGNAADMAKCEKSRDLLHLDVIDVKQRWEAVFCWLVFPIHLSMLTYTVNFY